MATRFGTRYPATRSMSEKQALVALTTLTLAPGEASDCATARCNGSANERATSAVPVTRPRAVTAIVMPSRKPPTTRASRFSRRPRNPPRVRRSLVSHVDDLHAAILLRTRIAGVLQVGLAVARRDQVIGRQIVLLHQVLLH